MNYREWFATWFHKFNPVDNVWLESHGLHLTVENSSYHREENVWVHTKMVVNEYFKLLGDKEWDIRDVIGGIACTFHDVGKPSCKEVITKEDGTTRNRFGGHEQRSACMWRDYLTQFPDEFKEIGTVEDIFYPVAWLIENHLPFSTKDKGKINQLVLTLDKLRLRQTFFNVLMADTLGRISDDHPEKIKAVQEWIDKFETTFDTPTVLTDRTVFFLIGASGSGKTSYVKQYAAATVDIFSYDDLRLEWYSDSTIVDPIEQYRHCFYASTEDSKFNEKALKHFQELLHGFNHIIVDNMNMSAKSRRALITFIRQNKNRCKIKAVIFVVGKDTINARQKTRSDKFLSETIIEQQYHSMSVPNYGEVDSIEINYN